MVQEGSEVHGVPGFTGSSGSLTREDPRPVTRPARIRAHPSFVKPASIRVHPRPVTRPASTREHPRLVHKTREHPRASASRHKDPRASASRETREHPRAQSTRSTNQNAPVASTISDPAIASRWAATSLRLRMAASADATSTTIAAWPISTPRLNDKS